MVVTEDARLDRELARIRDSQLPATDIIPTGTNSNEVVVRNRSRSGILKLLFSRRDKAETCNEKTETVTTLKRVPQPVRSPIATRRLVMIRDKQGQARLFHKETANAVHPTHGTMPLEKWEELSLSRSMKLEELSTARASPPSSISSLIKPLSMERAAGKSTSTTQNHQQTINVLGMQNVQLHFNVQDVFGVGLMWRFLAEVYRRHSEWLQSLSPLLRWTVVAWELAALSVLLWQLVLIVEWTGKTWSIANNILEDGIQTIETVGWTVHYVFRRLGSVLFGL